MYLPLFVGAMYLSLLCYIIILSCLVLPSSWRGRENSGGSGCFAFIVFQVFITVNIMGLLLIVPFVGL